VRTGVLSEEDRGSTRWPVQLAAAKQMNMEVGNGFTTVLSIIDDNAKAIFKVQFPCDLPGLEKEMPECRLIFSAGFPNTWNGLAWNNEQVGGCLWIDVTEGDTEVVLILDLAGNLAGHDFLKESFSHWSKGGRDKRLLLESGLPECGGGLGFGELPVLAGVTDVGGGVDAAQAVHDDFRNGTGWYFQVELVLEMVEGFIDEDLNLLAIAGSLGEGLAEPCEQLCLVKQFLGAIALDDK
jgi:hypothetical protein